MATKFTSAQVAAGADILAANENAARLDMLKNAGDYATSTGSANAYLLALDAQISAYVAGDVFKFKANFANTGSCSLNVNSIGALTIKRFKDVNLAPNDIVIDQLVEVMYDGTNLQMISPPRSAGFDFGDGSDGDVTIGADTSMTRDMYYNNLTISDTFTLSPKGHRIFVKGTLTCNGTGKIASNGGTGSNGSNAPSTGTGGAGGNGGSADYTYGTMPIPVAGGGGRGGKGDPTDGAAGTGTITSVTKPLNDASGVTGAAGGTGGASDEVTPESPGTKTGTGEKILQPNRAMNLGTNVSGSWNNAYTSVSNSGGGGGAHSNAATGSGGGGGGAGASGGCVLIVARSIASVAVEAKGGNGGNGGNFNGGTAQGGGGGAGGNGGVVVIIKHESTTISTSVVGGTGGTGGSPNGSTGTDGNAGRVDTLTV